MFNETTLAKLEFVLLMMGDVEKIVGRHSGLDSCLDDVAYILLKTLSKATGSMSIRQNISGI